MYPALKYYGKPIKWTLVIHHRHRGRIDVDNLRKSTTLAKREDEALEVLYPVFDEWYELNKSIGDLLGKNTGMITYSLELDDEEWSQVQTIYENSKEFIAQSQSNRRWTNAINLFYALSLMFIVIGYHAEVTCQAYSFRILKQCPNAIIK